MIEATTYKGTKVYVTAIDDCGENVGGFYCQVYADEDMNDELDYFVIHKEWLEEESYFSLTKAEEQEKVLETMIKEEVHSIDDY